MTATSVTPPNYEQTHRDWRMSLGLECNGFIFLTGLTGAKEDGSISDSPETQIRAAFQNVESVLECAGLNFGNVVELTTYHVGIHEHLALFRTIHAEFVVEPYPAWTAVEVSGLIDQGALVEIRTIAYRPAPTKPQE